jgi:NitT/TauT family transport system substrate-binding protein
VTNTRTIAILAALTMALTLTAGCTRADRAAQRVPVSSQGAAAEVRLGFFPNVTHAPALVGVQKNFFAGELGATTLSTQVFNAGPDEVNALLGGSLDVAFIGSGPAINAFAKSRGDIQLVAGAVSGGAQLVVRPEITSADQLVGKTIATPQLGNTQDVALKKWLAERDLTGKVNIANLDNPKTLDAFRKGEVHGGWLPEPWSSRLVLDAGATVLVDEKTLWPSGAFPTTVVIARREFLQRHPQTVRALLTGQLRAIEWANANPAEASTVVNAAIKEFAGSAMSEPVLDRAFAGIVLTPDPNTALFPQLAKDSVTAGVVKTVTDLRGFVEFGPLNEALRSLGKPAVDPAGLDKK